jgi:hypothetical protein
MHRQQPKRRLVQGHLILGTNPSQPVDTLKVLNSSYTIWLMASESQLQATEANSGYLSRKCGRKDHLVAHRINGKENGDHTGREGG